MRQRFMDEQLLLQKAKDEVEKGFVQLQRWWCKKYNLPSNHPLVLKMSPAEIQLEMFQDWWLEREGVLAKLDSEDTATRERDSLFTRLNELNRGLGLPEEKQDDLIDKWERELEEGQVPDLDER